MIFAINVYNLIFTCVYLFSFVISYFVILHTNFEKLFKQGQVVAIRIGQIVIALALAYLVTSGIMGVVSSKQFTV
jgi:uncharacterized membrane protein YwzB